MRWIEVDIDDVADGTMVYDAAKAPLGVVRDYLSMNGNYAPKKVRHLDNGKPSDRFAYRRSGLYRRAMKYGPVYILARSVPGHYPVRAGLSHPEKDPIGMGCDGTQDVEK